MQSRSKSLKKIYSDFTTEVQKDIPAGRGGARKSRMFWHLLKNRHPLFVEPFAWALHEAWKKSFREQKKKEFTTHAPTREHYMDFLNRLSKTDYWDLPENEQQISREAAFDISGMLLRILWNIPSDAKEANG